jgi:hypothetical protein
MFDNGGARRRSAWSRFGAGVVAVIMLLGGVSCIGLYYLALPSAEKSSYTQAHGVRRTAVIELVDNVAQLHGGKHQKPTKTYTSQVQVRLTAPVGGQTESWVHEPRYESGSPGTSITVLVDPKDPGYAELPGTPADDSPASDLVFLLLAAAGFVFGIVAGGWALWPRRRRGQATSRPPRWD